MQGTVSVGFDTFSKRHRDIAFGRRLTGSPYPHPSTLHRKTGHAKIHISAIVTVGASTFTFSHDVLAGGIAMVRLLLEIKKNRRPLLVGCMRPSEGKKKATITIRVGILFPFASTPYCQLAIRAFQLNLREARKKWACENSLPASR